MSLLAQRVAARYKNKKKVKTQDGDEQVVYEYSERQVQNRNNEKANKLEDFRKNKDKLEKQVKKDLKADGDETRQIALAIALIDATYERVGNPGSAKDGHFGVTEWRAKHIKFNDGKATIKYVGKSGVDQTKTVDDPVTVAALKKAVADISGDDPIFDIGASDVNTYLEPYDITAKDIRGFRANYEMNLRLKEVRKEGPKLPADKKEREKLLKDEFKEALKDTAEVVGHTTNILKKNYLVPGLEEDYLQKGIVSEKLKKRSYLVSRITDRFLRGKSCCSKTFPKAAHFRSSRRSLLPSNIK